MEREFKKRRFAYCSEGYTINGIGFDKGYIQELEEGELFFENSNWRYATDSEVKDFHSTPYSYQAKGRYFTNKCNDY